MPVRVLDPKPTRATKSARGFGASEVPHLDGTWIIDLHHRQVLDAIQRLVWAWYAFTEILMPARHACSRVSLRSGRPTPGLLSMLHARLPQVRDVIPGVLEGNCEIVRDKEIIDGFR